MAMTIALYGLCLIAVVVAAGVAYEESHAWKVQPETTMEEVTAHVRFQGRAKVAPMPMRHVYHPRHAHIRHHMAAHMETIRP